MINSEDAKFPYSKKFSKNQNNKISISMLKKTQTIKKFTVLSMTSSV